MHVALHEIRNDLPTGNSTGRKLAEEPVTGRFGENPTTDFRDKIPQTKSKTSAALHSILITTSSGQATTIKADGIFSNNLLGDGHDVKGYHSQDAEIV